MKVGPYRDSYLFSIGKQHCNFRAVNCWGWSSCTWCFGNTWRRRWCLRSLQHVWYNSGPSWRGWIILGERGCNSPVTRAQNQAKSSASYLSTALQCWKTSSSLPVSDGTGKHGHEAGKKHSCPKQPGQNIFEPTEVCPVLGNLIPVTVQTGLLPRVNSSSLAISYSLVSSEVFPWLIPD